MMRWAQQGWERLSLYLPVLLMGLLALGTWWLVRNAPRRWPRRSLRLPRPARLFDEKFCGEEF